MRVSQRLGVLFGCLLLWSAGMLALWPAWSFGSNTDGSRHGDTNKTHASLAAGFDDDDLDTTVSAAPPALAADSLALLRPSFSQDLRVACLPRLTDRRSATLVGCVVLHV